MPIMKPKPLPIPYPCGGTGFTCYILPSDRVVCPEDPGYQGIANAYEHGAPFEAFTTGGGCGSPNVMVALYAPF